MQNTQGQWDSKCSLFSTSRCKKKTILKDHRWLRQEVFTGRHSGDDCLSFTAEEGGGVALSCNFPQVVFKNNFPQVVFLKIQIILIQVELQTLQDKIPVTHFPPFVCINSNKFRTIKDVNFQMELHHL